MEKVKKIGIVILTIYLVLLTIVVGFYGYFRFFSPETIVTRVNYLTPINTKNTNNPDDFKYFIEFNYYSNEYNDGYKMIEMRINSYNDTNWDNMSGYGLQFVHVDSDNPYYGKIFDYETFDGFICWGTYNQYYYYYFVNRPNYVEYYQTDHSSNNSIVASKYSRLQTNSQFFWKIGESNYRLEFLNDNLLFNDYGTVFAYFNSYIKRDYMYFFFQVKNQLNSFDYGTTTKSIFNYGELFKYYYEETNPFGQKQFREVVNESSLMEIRQSDYLQMKVTKSRHGVRVASDSLFGSVNGNVSWKYDKEVNA